MAMQLAILKISSTLDHKNVCFAENRSKILSIDGKSGMINALMDIEKI